MSDIYCFNRHKIFIKNIFYKRQMDTNIGQYLGQKNTKVKDIDVFDIKDIRKRSLQVFENREYFNLAILKTEKLASALYLVSNLISDNEPLKWTMRKIGTDIISDISLMGVGSFDKGHKVSLEKMTAKIFEMTSLLQVAWMGGLISNMNFEILRSEYFKLGEFLKEKFYSTTPDKLLVSENFFISEELKNLEERATNVSKENLFCHSGTRSELADNDPILTADTPTAAQDTNSFIRDISYKGHLANKPVIKEELLSFNNRQKMNDKRQSSTSIERMSDINKKKRHSLILSVLKPGISYSVPEILNLIGMGDDLSEKTIQRDLLQLVSNNSLKKTGERRWSRYQLI